MLHSGNAKLRLYRIILLFAFAASVVAWYAKPTSFRDELNNAHIRLNPIPEMKGTYEISEAQRAKLEEILEKMHFEVHSWTGFDVVTYRHQRTTRILYFWKRTQVVDLFWPQKYV
ncbi:MAG: hypothetical protein JST51_13225 [Armatimonadetes bacterium]|nr:hypothetical protein [Armatimonadota bacterium]